MDKIIIIKVPRFWEKCDRSLAGGIKMNMREDRGCGCGYENEFRIVGTESNPVTSDQ